MATTVSTKARESILKFGKDESGATAVEYALIIGLLAAIIIAAGAVLGGGISNAFYKVRCNVVGGTWTDPTAGASATSANCTK